MRGHRRRRATQRWPATPTRPQGCGGMAGISSLLLLADGVASTRRRASICPPSRPQQLASYFLDRTLALGSLSTNSSVPILSRMVQKRSPERAVVLMLAAFAVFAISCVSAAAQNVPESEVGFVFSLTRFSEEEEAGFGARFLHNYSRSFGFEYQGTFYGVDPSVNFYQNSFNFKNTFRGEGRRKVNLFVVAGPGFLIEDRASAASKTRFSVNVGGGLELVPERRMVIRVDLTDYVFFARGDSINNFDFKLAVMYRW